MALEMTGEYALPLPSDAVWSALNDPEFLQRCIPGCESFEKLSDTEFVAIVRLAVGPVKARFKGRVELQDLNPPQSYTIVGQGEGGIAGFAKGNAAVTLTNLAEGTILSYRAQAQIGGKIAQLGQRLVAGTAKRITDLFFANCVAELSQNQGSLDVKQSTDVS
jgi:carbon monoxide dehydrogenase subunit G